MSGKFDLGNYVEVDERITRFYDRYPDGRLTTVGTPQVIQIGDKTFIVAQAAAYRTADDPRPCVGTAAEAFPGQTTFTKDSEMMNAETSAWGRALVAAGILAKGEKVASRNEVRNRQGATATGPVSPTDNQRSGTASPAPPANPGAQSPAPAGTGAPEAVRLLVLAASLPRPVEADTINGLLKKYGAKELVTRMENAHKLQCGSKCPHIGDAA